MRHVDLVVAADSFEAETLIVCLTGLFDLIGNFPILKSSPILWPDNKVRTPNLPGVFLDGGCVQHVQRFDEQPNIPCKYVSCGQSPMHAIQHEFNNMVKNMKKLDKSSFRSRHFDLTEI